MIVLRGLSVQMCCVALMLLAGCAVPSPGEFESLLTQRDEVAINEKQRADLINSVRILCCSILSVMVSSCLLTRC